MAGVSRPPAAIQDAVLEPARLLRERRRPVVRQATPAVAPWEKIVLAVLLASYLAALVWLAWRTGVTVDEPSHLLSAHLYWQGQDKLEPRDMPPLIKLVGGWVPGVLGGLPLPYDDPALMNTGHEWNISQGVMERLGTRAPRLFFFSRLPMLIFPLLTVLLLWWWGRQIFSPVTGVILAGLFMFEPTALGHGPLFKNDLASTFTFLLFWYAAWRYWRRPSTAGAGLLGTALLLAVLSKLSMLVLVPVAPGFVLARWLTLPPRRVRALAAALALVLLIPYLGSIVAVQFETRRLQDWDFVQMRRHQRTPEAFLFVSNVLRVLPYPKPLYQGTVSILQSNHNNSVVYFWGKERPEGHPLYFLGALALKVPVPLQVLLLAGLAFEAVAALRRRRSLKHSLFWLVPPFLYIALASASTLQLGVRLVLPALPFGLLIAGRAVESLRRRWPVAVLAVPLVAMAAGTARNYPHGISFINAWAGSSYNGARYLSDSNVDWGQDGRELTAAMDRLGIAKLRLFYFGNDFPTAYTAPGRVEELPPPWDPQFTEGPIYRPRPGYYAVSASLLPGHFFEPEYRDYFRVFRETKPVGRVGHSIYIYEFRETER